jgi:hypothetical protein
MFFYFAKTSEKKAAERKDIASKSAFSFENAPRNSIKGDITILSGEVNWLSRTATEPAGLVSNTKIQQGEELQTGKKGNVSVVFPSLGILSLSENTNVKIIQTIPSSFVLTQTSGTAEYEKTSTGEFSIRSLHLLSTIDSGRVTITVDEIDKEITIIVHTGTLTVGYNDLDNISTVQTLSKGETLIFNDETRDTTIKK